jgi:hypothetical protein
LTCGARCFVADLGQSVWALSSPSAAARAPLRSDYLVGAKSARLFEPPRRRRGAARRRVLVDPRRGRRRGARAAAARARGPTGTTAAMVAFNVIRLPSADARRWVGRCRVASGQAGTFASAPLRTGHARFRSTRLSSAAHRDRLPPPRLRRPPVAALRSSRTSLLTYRDTWPPSPCGRLSRPRTTTRPPSP